MCYSGKCKGESHMGDCTLGDCIVGDDNCLCPEPDIIKSELERLKKLEYPTRQDMRTIIDLQEKEIANLIEKNLYNIVKGKNPDDRQAMKSDINENLDRLSLHEMGKVYKFIRRNIIANIKG